MLLFRVTWHNFDGIKKFSFRYPNYVNLYTGYRYKKMPDPRTLTEEEFYRARIDFQFFLNNVFSASFEKRFIPGEHLNRWATIMQNYPLTALLSARKHSKSTTSYAFVLWNIFKNMDIDFEILYLSYNNTMASYHTRNIKILKERNPYFVECKDLTKQAEGVMKYDWDGTHIVRVEPEGMLSFKRGRHPDLVIIDDPLQDPANILNISTIQKINRVFFEDVMSLPKEPDGELKIVGTAQHPQDLFFNLRKMDRFYWGEYKAITSWKTEEVLWPEMMPWARLMQIKQEIGDKAFEKEYMCSPVLSEEAFFKRGELLPSVDLTLKNWRPGEILKTENNVYGGFDIGKKRHPTSISVFEEKRKELFQLHQVFLDGWDYKDQVDYARVLCDNLKIDRLFYDDTRGEFESYSEEGRLPAPMRPVKFSLKTKYLMASIFEKLVKEKRIHLLNNERMINQILVVDNNLDAIETTEGHGDSFWSIGLACMGVRDVGKASVIDLNLDDLFQENSLYPKNR